MAWVGPLIDLAGEDITLRVVAYGAADAETGHKAITFTESTIKASIVRLPGRSVRTTGGDTADDTIRVISATSMKIHDQVIYHGVTYKVITEPRAHLTQYYFDVNARRAT